MANTFLNHRRLQKAKRRRLQTRTQDSENRLPRQGRPRAFRNSGSLLLLERSLDSQKRKFSPRLCEVQKNLPADLLKQHKKKDVSPRSLGTCQKGLYQERGHRGDKRAWWVCGQWGLRPEFRRFLCVRIVPGDLSCLCSLYCAGKNKSAVEASSARMGVCPSCLPSPEDSGRVLT